MTDPLTSFSTMFRRPDNTYAAAYQTLVGVYDKFANDTQGLKKVLARMHRELEALKTKATKHNSQSLQQLIAVKSEELQSATKILETDRDTYFSEGKMIAEKVNAYMTLFRA